MIDDRSASSILFWIGAVALGIGLIGSLFPLWKSATTSPDSLMRRFYWSGSTAFVICIFASQVPDWKDATFGACAFGLGLVLIAFFRGSHIKIGGRIVAAYPSHRRPDRPPALSDENRQG